MGFALASRGWMAFASIPFIALWGIAGPAMQSLMSQRVDPTSQGKLQGAINSLRAITGMIGPLLFTQVFAVAISPHVRVHVPGAPYYLAALLMLASASVAYIVGRPAVPVAARQTAGGHS
jgi:DHA1 family tetracycline resistance protein-like MFS transporter